VIVSPNKIIKSVEGSAFSSSDASQGSMSVSRGRLVSSSHICPFETHTLLTAFKKVLPIPSPTSIYILQDYNKMVLHHGAELTAYSSEVLARYALGRSSKASFDATYEKIAGNEGSVLFCRPGQVGRRTMCKPLLSTTPSFNITSTPASDICV
jgi:hypothetical protein